MTLISFGTGSISLGTAAVNADVNIEIGNAATATLSFNDPKVRVLTSTTNVSQISASQFYGQTYTTAPVSFTPIASFATAGTPDFTSVAFGAGLFVAISDGGIYSSPDGINWTQRALAITYCTQIIFASGYFVAVGTSGRYAYSTTGTSWTVATIAGATSYSLVSVVYNSFGFYWGVAATNGSTSNFIYTTVSGGNPSTNSWTQQLISGLSSTTVLFSGSAASGTGSQSVFTGNNTNTGQGYIITGNNGNPLFTGNAPAALAGHDFTGLVYVSGTLYGFNTTYIGTSTTFPFTTWTNASNTSAALTRLSSPASFSYANGYFIESSTAISGSPNFAGAISYSTTPTSNTGWTISTTNSLASSFQNIASVTFGNGIYVAVGSAGYIAHT